MVLPLYSWTPSSTLISLSLDVTSVLLINYPLFFQLYGFSTPDSVLTPRSYGLYFWLFDVKMFLVIDPLVSVTLSTLLNHTSIPNIKSEIPSTPLQGLYFSYLFYYPNPLRIYFMSEVLFTKTYYYCLRISVESTNLFCKNSNGWM